MIGFKLSHFYKHCRDKILKLSFLTYFGWFFYSFGSGVALYFIPKVTFSQISNDGSIISLWTIGFTMVFVMTYTNHIMTMIATRNWSIFMGVLFFTSII